MEVTKEELEKSKIQLKISLVKEEIEDDLQTAYKDVARKYNIPGFRKGKAPPSVIDAKIGKEEVYEAMLKRSLPQFYVKALEETKITPVASPKLDVESFDEEAGVVFTATIIIKPPVAIENYKGIEIEVPESSVQQSEIDEQVDLLRKKYASLQTVDRPIKEGDHAKVDYTVEVDGKSIERLAAQDYLMEIAKGKIHENLYDELIGATSGDIKQTEVSMSDDYPEIELAGKNVRFKFLIKEVKENVLPELKDEFAQEVSRFDTAAELIEDITKKITSQKQEAKDLLTRRSLMDKIIEKADVEVPQEMIDAQTEHMIKQFDDALRQQGQDLTKYLASIGSTPDALQTNYAEEARAMIVRDLVLEAIAEKEGISVTSEDLKEDLEKYAKANKQSIDEITKTLEESGKLDDLEHAKKTEKTLNLLLEQAKIKEVKNNQKSEKSRKKQDKIEK